MSIFAETVSRRLTVPPSISPLFPYKRLSGGGHKPFRIFLSESGYFVNCAKWVRASIIGITL